MSKPIDFQIIENARDLIKDEENWFGKGSSDCGYHARNCAWLAICAAMTNITGKPYNFSERIGTDRPIAKLIKKRFDMTVLEMINFNNTHTHTEVLALFDKAMEKVTA